MKTKTKVNASGPNWFNHNQTGLRLATKVKAGGPHWVNHNQTAR